MKKYLSLSNIVFAVFLALLIIPQTRKPIQVGLNKVRMLLLSPSKLDPGEQIQVIPFAYKLYDLNANALEVGIGKGKVAFLSYWATWCPPCLAELPSIQVLYSRYGDRIEFVLITNEDPEVVSRFLDKKNYDLPVYLPRMNPPEVLSERSIPTNYIIDAKGKILVKEQGAVDWNSEKVREILEKNIPR
ncbi:TlpA family protein disulfide reductase [Robiginitalea sp. IMCC44478]|uniref:TlpA family protein disulfide reductase n=1 Tax=Robiginitalea sp. IMCC44478 TaxID=3459122 RepID=UPI0040423D16